MAPQEYLALTFPDALVAPGEAWGLTATDPAYATALAGDGWQALVGELRSPSFVRSVLDALADDMRAAGCLVDPAAVRVVEFEETREQKALPSLGLPGRPSDVFTRVDFQSKAEGGYREFVHLDWARRIVGGILFFSDAVEEGLEGGELAFYRDRAFQDDRWCHDPELVATFAPAHNSGVIFLNTNGAFHGPRAIRRLAGRRRWLYFTISSVVDVWPSRTRVTV